MLWLLIVAAAIAAALFVLWRRTARRPETVALPLAPPLGPLLGIACGALLELMLPTSLPLTSMGVPLGVGALALGVAINVAAFTAFRGTGASPNPGRVVPVVVDRGVFGITRNPMYAGFLLVHVGIAFWSDSLWILFMVVPAWAVLRYAIIAREEEYMRGRFPGAFDNYCRRVRRWL